MTLPEPIFVVMLWLALAALCGGAGFLIVVLVKEWRDGTLW